jgi:sugar O-acyltransferase (sialic acid O-acetyltransferase NeuD family)
MNLNEIYIIGGGGHAKVVASAAISAEFKITYIFDDNSSLLGTSLCGVPVIGPCAKIQEFPPRPTVIAIGDNLHRFAVADRFDLPWQTVIDPRAYLHFSVVCGHGVMVLPGAIVQIDSQLGNHVIVNKSASIDHDCRLGDFVHIAPGVRLAGNVQIGNGVLVGLGAVVLPGIAIGNGAVIGAGATVIRDVPDNAVLMGVPGRIHSFRSPSPFCR